LAPAVTLNHLLHIRKSEMEEKKLTFAGMGASLDGVRAGDFPDKRALPVETQLLLEEEAKAGCIPSMLMCLDRRQRLAFILGEVFGEKSKIATQAMGQSAARSISVHEQPVRPGSIGPIRAGVRARQTVSCATVGWTPTTCNSPETTLPTCATLPPTAWMNCSRSTENTRNSTECSQVFGDEDSRRPSFPEARPRNAPGAFREGSGRSMGQLAHS
jgi:hypothetical protein